MKQPLRIQMVLDNQYPPDVRVQNEARSLVKAGFEVTILAIGQDARPTRETVDGALVIRDPLPTRVRNVMRGLVSTVPLMDAYVARRLRALHRERPFDVLHVHDLYLVGGGLRAGRALGVPVVADLHENWVEALKHYAWSSRYPRKLLVSIPRWERTERRWVHAADHLVVVIEEAARRYEAMGVTPDKITVVPNTVELDSFTGYALEPDLVERLHGDPLLVYTGAIDAHRGLDTVLDGMPALLATHPGARLVIVGDGRTRPELEAQAARLGLGDAVRFEGYQPQARLKSYIAAADLCVIPHLKTVHTDATIPHKLFHGMVMGKPVVVSNCLPLERIVEAEGAGIVFASGDPADFARQVGAVAGDAERLRAMGEAGRAAVLARYNWDATAAGLIELYREMEG